MKRLSDNLFAYFPYIFSFIYFILLMFIETSTLFAFQNKSFLLTREYLAPFLTKSGGLMDYLGLFLSEILRFNFAGAFLYSLITLASILLYKSLLQKSGVTVNLLLISLYPFIFLVLLTFNHFHPLAMNLKLLIVLLLLQYLIFSSGRSKYFKIMSVLILIGCWYLCGMEYYLIAIGYLTIHTIIVKTAVKNITVISISLISVLLINTFIFYTPLIETLLSTNEIGSQIPYILLITYLLFILMPVTAVIKLNTTFDNSLQLLIILVIGYFLGARSFNQVYQVVGKILVAGNAKKYSEVLLLRENTQINTVIISAYTNIALLNKRRLLDDMFRYNQGGGRQGLFPSLEYDNFKAFINMKSCSDIGLPNLTIRWAMEATTYFGYNTEILIHLIEAHLINDNLKGAKKYYSIFKRTLFNKRQKERIGRLLARSVNGTPDKYILEKREMMPSGDFFTGNDNDKESFAWAKEVDGNLKAFEWYIAICLLENDLEAVKEALTGFRRLGYKKLPVHVQEAICLFNVGISLPIDLQGYEIDPLILEDYRLFLQTLRRHNDNLQSARNELEQQIDNRYWFYRYYTSPVKAK